MGLLNGDDKKKKKGKAKKLPSGILLPNAPAARQEATAVAPRLPDYGPTPIQSLPTVTPRGVQGGTGRSLAEESMAAAAERTESGLFGLDTFKPGTVRYSDKLDWGVYTNFAGEEVNRREDGTLKAKAGYKVLETLAKSWTQRSNGDKDEAQMLFDTLLYMVEPPNNQEELDAYTDWALDVDASWEDMPKGTLGVEGTLGLPNVTGIPLALRDVAKDFRRGELSGYTAMAALGALPILSPALRSGAAIRRAGGLPQLNRLASQFIKHTKKLDVVELMDFPRGTSRWGNWTFRLPDGNTMQVRVRPSSREPSGGGYYMNNHNLIKLHKGEVTLDELVEQGKAWQGHEVANFSISNPRQYDVNSGPYGYGAGDTGLGPPPPDSSRGKYGNAVLRAMMRYTGFAVPEVKGYILSFRETGTNRRRVDIGPMINNLRNRGIQVQGVAMPAVVGGATEDAVALLAPSKPIRMIDADPITGRVLTEVLSDELGIPVQKLRDLEADVIANIMPEDVQPAGMRKLEDRMEELLGQGMEPEAIVMELSLNETPSISPEQARPMLREIMKGVLPDQHGNPSTRLSSRMYAGVTDEAIEGAKARMSAAGTNPVTREIRSSGAALQRMNHKIETMQNAIRQRTGDDTWTVRANLDPTNLDNVIVTMENADPTKAASLSIEASGSTSYPYMEVVSYAGDETTAAALATVINTDGLAGGTLQYSQNSLGDLLSPGQRAQRISIIADNLGAEADLLMQGDPTMSVDDALARAMVDSPASEMLTQHLVRENAIVDQFGAGSMTHLRQEDLAGGAEYMVGARATSRRAARHQASMQSAREISVIEGREAILTAIGERARAGRPADDILATSDDIAIAQARVDELIAQRTELPTDLRNRARDEAMETIRGAERSRNERVIRRVGDRVANSPETAGIHEDVLSRGGTENEATQAIRDYIEAELSVRYGQEVMNNSANRGLVPDDLYEQVPHLATFRAEDLRRQAARRARLGPISVAQGADRADLPTGPVARSTGPMDEFKVPAPTGGSRLPAEGVEALVALRLDEGAYASPAHAAVEVAREFNISGEDARSILYTTLRRMERHGSWRERHGSYADMTSAGVQGTPRFGGANGDVVNMHQLQELYRRGVRPAFLDQTGYEQTLVATEQTHRYRHTFVDDAGEASRAEPSDEFVRVRDSIAHDRADAGRAGASSNLDQAARRADADPVQMRDSSELVAAVRNDALYRLQVGEANDLEDLFQRLSDDWNVPIDRELRSAVRGAITNHGYDEPYLRFRGGAVIDDPDIYSFGILADNVGPAASTLRDAGATPAEMAYSLSRVGFEPSAIHSELRGRFPDIDSAEHAATVEKTTGTNPVQAAEAEDAAFDTSFPDPPPVPEANLPPLTDLSEGELRAVFTADDIARTYQTTYGGSPEPDMVRHQLIQSGYTLEEANAGVARLGTRNPIEEEMRTSLIRSGWEPGMDIPFDEIAEEVGRGRSEQFTSTVMGAFRRFMADESGSKVIGRAPRGDDRDRVRRAYEAYQQMGGYSDYEIRRMLSQEGYAFDAIEDVGESITGQSYRTTEGAPGHQPAEGGGMTRREFSQTMGAAGAGLAAGGGGGLLRSGAEEVLENTLFRQQVNGLVRMHGPQYAENARQIVFGNIMDAMEEGATGAQLGPMIDALMSMPRGGELPTTLFAGRDHGLQRLRAFVEGNQGNLPISSRQLNALATSIEAPAPGMTGYAADEIRPRPVEPRPEARMDMSEAGQKVRETRRRPGGVEVTDLDRQIAERHNARYRASENPAEDYSIGSTTSSSGGDPDKRYLVSPSKEWEVRGGNGGLITPEEVAAYRTTFSDKLTDGRYIGTWFNPDDGRVYLDISEGYDYPSQARRVAQNAEQEGFFDFHTERFMPTSQEPIPEGARYMPPPAEGYERWVRGVGKAVPERRAHGADADPTRGRWFLEESGVGRSIAGDYGRVDPQRFSPEDRGAMVAVDVPRGTPMDPVPGPRGRGGAELMPRERLPDVRLEQGKGILAVQDNPNAIYPRPDPRRALLPSLLAGAYLGMQQEEEPQRGSLLR